MGDLTLVTGGTGLIGSRLIEALRSSGSRVRMLTRNPATEPLAPGVEVVVWNGSQLPPGALSGCAAVVHLAGEPIFGGLPTASRRRRIVSSRIDSTESIAAALRAAPAADRPSSFVCASAVGFYGSRRDELLDESSAPGSGFLADLCQKWEAAATRAGVRTVSLRTGIVLARDGGALPLMALPFRFGLGGRLGDGSQWVPWIHVDDVVELIRAVVQNPGFRGPVNAVAPNPVRNRELTTALAATLRRPALLPVPAFVLRAALGELSGELLGSRRCVARAALDAGFEFAHTVVETALQTELA